MSQASPTNAWRKYKSQRDLPDSDITIALAGSMTIEPLEAFIGTHLLGKGYNPNFIIAPYNQIQQLCYNPFSILGKSPDIIVLIWRIEDLLPNIIDFDINQINAALSEISKSLESLVQTFSGTIIVSLPPYPSLPSFDLESLQYVHGKENIFNKFLQIRNLSFSHIDRVHFFDLQALITKIGTDNAHDARKWLLYKEPWTEYFWSLAGKQISRLICAQKISSKKCIVLDADNTLWGGIIGEDGIQGIELGNDFPGNAYKEFQKYLLHLQKSGIMLAVASKNNESDFFEVIDNHSDMILKRENFLSFQINWGSKADSIRNIAQELNIVMDSIVFIDDSAKEIAEISERLPEVTCLQVPEEISDLPHLLIGIDLFDKSEITEEDKKRTEMIRANQSRHKIQNRLTAEEFKASLELKMNLFVAQKLHIARITQLINKTNQFNLTTIRRTQDDLERIMRLPTHIVLGMELSDKFGDYGLVGVAILEKKKDSCLIETLLMSCRVLGRDAETAFLFQLSNIAKDWGCRSIKGPYIETAKNNIVRNLYKDHGFSYDSMENIWTVNTNILKKPEHIKIQSL